MSGHGWFYTLQFKLFLASIPFLAVGLIGNVLVVRIVHKTRQMHTTTNYLLVNLAFSDIIIILMLPLYIFLDGYLSDHGVGKFVCKVLSIGEISITVSSLTLTVIAIERYHALLKPFRAGLRLTASNSKPAIVVIWISSVVFCSPFLVFQEWNKSQSSCTSPWDLNTSQVKRVYVLFNVAFVTYIPLLVMLYCYGSLIKGLYFSNTICSESQGERSHEKKKLVCTFILATAGFFIGYGPFVIFHTLVAAGSGQHLRQSFYFDISSVFHILLSLSLCLNPILYAFRSKNFQEGLKRVILHRRPASPDEPMYLQ